MGIKQLFKTLSEHAPKAVKETKMENLTGRTVAIDASTCLYQFLVAIRISENQHQNLTNEAGEVTSHLNGFFARTIKLFEAGIKPVFVFDGKPPELKAAEINERREKKEKAEAELKVAIEEGDNEAIRKASSRSVKVTQKMTADVKRLLQGMGCPVVDAASEAEATCAALNKAGKVYASATEDMDVLTFGSPVMLKNLFNTIPSKGAAGGRPVYEISLPVALAQLDITMDQFIDFCILSGCDYLETIPKIGPSMAFKLIAEHKSIEKVLESLDPTKYPVPQGWDHVPSRNFFKSPEVSDLSQIKLVWGEPNYEDVRKLLVDENQFQAERVDKQLDRLRAAKAKKTQQRLDSYFQVRPKEIKEGEKYDPFAKKGTVGKRASVGGAAPASKKGRK